MTTLTDPQRLRFDVANLNCAGCASRAEAALSKVEGVRAARVNFATRHAHVLTDIGVSADVLVSSLDQAGYPLSPVAADTVTVPDLTGETVRFKRAFLWALALTLPVFVPEMAGHLVPSIHHAIANSIGLGLWRLIQLVLTAAVLIGPGWIFFRLGVPALLRRAPDMNSLVALGAGTAWLWSAAVTLFPRLMPTEAVHVYFEAAAVIVTLILLGRWLEAGARGKAGEAISGLLKLRPDTAIVLDDEDRENEVPLSDILPGDTVVLRPGARIPVDGTVVLGQSDVDEAMLTGEPLPIAKCPDDQVFAGTINGTGSLRINAEAIGAETALGRIVSLVSDAQATRLPVQAIIDRVTAVFVPVVLVIALAAAAIWLLAGAGTGTAVLVAVSVLIIACPCAMGLATPVSILAGTGRAAELGVLFRQGEALQTLAKIDVVAFDKTGTLTLGQPQVVGVSGATETLALAAAAERSSEHPLARAILRYAEDQGVTLLDCENFQSHPGGGVTAVVEGADITIGSAAFLERSGIATDPIDDGATEVWVARNGSILGRITLEDAEKPEARSAIAALKANGHRIAILSGDRQAPVDAVAKRLGISDAQGGLTPDGKQAALRDWQAQGLKVAFVGDGINDAPVLAAADVGIALGTGTDVAIEAGGVVLTSGDLTGVARAVDLSRATLSNIKQNLIWAFGYNVALIPVAAGALAAFGGPLLNPMLGAGAMAASSVLVVLNALRLRRRAE